MTEAPARAGAANSFELPTSSATSAKTAGRDDDEDDAPERKPKRARRAFLTQNACRRCRQKKSKCDGGRPTCSRCAKYTTECTYDVAQEGLTRMQNLQQQLENKTIDHDRLQDLFRAIGEGTDEQASALLARLRLSASVTELLEYAQSSRNALPNADNPMAQTLWQNDREQNRDLQNQYQLPSQPGYGQWWDSNNVHDMRHWNPWNQDAVESSTPQSASSFQSETQLRTGEASQRFQYYLSDHEQHYPHLSDMMTTNEEASYPNALNLQTQESNPLHLPQPYAMPLQYQYGGYLSGPRNREQMHVEQIQARESQGGQNQRRQSQTGQSPDDSRSGGGPGGSQHHPT